MMIVFSLLVQKEKSGSTGCKWTGLKQLMGLNSSMDMRPFAIAESASTVHCHSLSTIGYSRQPTNSFLCLHKLAKNDIMYIESAPVIIPQAHLITHWRMRSVKRHSTVSIFRLIHGAIFALSIPQRDANGSPGVLFIPSYVY